jgi:hypothetical protein
MWTHPLKWQLPLPLFVRETSSDSDVLIGERLPGGPMLPPPPYPPLSHDQGGVVTAAAALRRTSSMQTYSTP